MGLIDRDYYREGTGDQAKARNRRGGRRQQQQWPPTTQPPQYQQQVQQPQQFNQVPNVGWTPYDHPEKRGIPAPAWVAIIGLLVIVCLLLAVIAALVVKNNPTSTSQEQVAFEPTIAPTLAPRPTATPLPTTVAPSIPAVLSQQPASSQQVAQILDRGGQELVGQIATDANFQYTVTKVGKYSQIQNAKGKVFQAQGAYVLVDFDLKNISKQNVATLLLVDLVDSQGRVFTGSTNFDLLLALNDLGLPKTDLTINPGLSGKGRVLFEVPTDAIGFKLKTVF